MGDIKVGIHDTGFWDAGNPINATKKAIATGLTPDQAIEQAKKHAGAEVVIVNADGKASLHALSVEDSFLSENKKVLISELDRDPAAKVNSAKTPLAIDNNVANALFGQGAFLVDDKNQTTYLGNDVDQTTASVKLQDADKFLQTPTQSKVDAAYTIARDAGNERHVDKTVARQALEQLGRNYRQSDLAAQQVSYLKPGETKVKMEALIGELKTLAGQESNRVAELTGQLNTRTGKWQADLKAPTEKRNTTLDAWERANSTETQLVTRAAYNLREARMPNIHNLEQTLDRAQDDSANARQQLDSAVQRRIQSQSRVNELERLPGEAEGHLQQARQLQSENRGMYVQIQSYTVLNLAQVQSELNSVEREMRSINNDLTNERNKPSRPTGGSNSHEKDPFAGGGNSHEKDPFAGGVGSNKPSHTQDPFAGSSGNYRDEGKINDLDRKLSRLRSDRDDLRERESGLSSVSLRLAVTQDVDQLSMLFYNLDPLDRTNLSIYKDRKDRNDRSISELERTASNKRSRYNNEINGAQRSLAESTSHEESSRARYGQTEGRVANLQQDLRDLTQNPRPDNHPEVKPAAIAHQKAVDHKEATVGSNAPLTVNRDKAQAVVDGINQEYRKDKQSLEGQISNVQQSLLSDAQSKINQTRTQVVK